MPSRRGGECAARTIHRVSAVEGIGAAARRSSRPVTPDIRAANVSLRLATRSSCRVSPQISSTTAPSASQASASARCPQRGLHVGRAHRHQEARIEAEFAPSAHRQRAGFDFRKILPHPQQRPPRADAPRQPCDESRRRGALPAFGEHLMHRAQARPPRSAASAPAWPSAARSGAVASWVSMRSMLPRKFASVRVRAPVMRRSWKMWPLRFWKRTRSWLICS